jgi:hypothetical protein
LEDHDLWGGTMLLLNFKIEDLKRGQGLYEVRKAIGSMQEAIDWLEIAVKNHDLELPHGGDHIE